jgi:hypothetical protein
VPCKSVVAECLYGNSPECLEGLDRHGHRVSMVAMPSDTRAWRAGPVRETTPSRSGGEGRTTRQVAAKDRLPPSVAAIAHRLPAGCWSRRTGSERTKGPITSAWTKRRVTLCRDGVPDWAVWLVM